MDYYMSVSWKAEEGFCTQYTQILSEKNVTLDKEVTIRGDDDMSLFWVPDIFISNAKSSFMQSQVLSTKFMTIRREDGKSCDMQLISR